MRKLLVLLAASLALAGCGGDDGGGAAGPLDEALGYMPADAPLVVAISTDVEGPQYEALERIARKFPFGGPAIQSLRSSIEEDGIDYEDDVRPLLGNEFVIGAVDARSLLQDEERFVGAIETRDGDKLEELAKKDSEEVGEAEGATIYRSDDTFIAVNGDVAVFGDSEEDVERALEARESDDRLTEEDLEGAFEGLPEKPLARIYANVETLLEASPESAQARRIEWVSALRELGMTFGAGEDGLSVDFALTTEGLSEEDLPLAAGDPTPGVTAGKGEIGVGIRGLTQIVRFAEAAGQAVDPEGFREYAAAKRTLDSQLKIDLDRDLIAQFTGDASIAFDVEGGFAVRAAVEDPDALEKTLEKVADAIPGFAQGAGFGEVGIARPRGGEDFYAVAQPDGDSVVFGVVEGLLVAADDPERAAALAGEQPQRVEGARGSVAVRANAEQLAERVLSMVELGGAGAFASLVVGPLGELTGSLHSAPDGLRGRFKLEIE